LRVGKIIELKKITRHSYPDFTVKLAVELYIYSHCGFEKVSGLIKYLNELLGLGIERIPCANTIENWVKKTGYSLYHQTPEELSEKEYATIMDESMMLGSEKMILSLAVEAEKSNHQALQHKDVKVLDISVAGKWNSSTISGILKETTNRVGHKPLYVISDNDTKLSKSFREQGYNQIRDIGHTMARLIEQVYGKEEDFKSYTKQLSEVKVREVMRPCSYLLPPRQRAIARFMNLSPILKWSKQINHNFSQLNEEEAKNFMFVKEHLALIEELERIFNCVNSILEQAKNQGFSKKNINHYIHELQNNLSHYGTRVEQVKTSLCNYLKEEKEKLQTLKNTWHCSSDIIESLFGEYKFRKARNPLHGITTYVLVLPVIAAMGHLPESSNLDFKGKLESVFMSNLTQWKENKLTENLTIKRRSKLAS